MSSTRTPLSLPGKSVLARLSGSRPNDTASASAASITPASANRISAVRRTLGSSSRASATGIDCGRRVAHRASSAITRSTSSDKGSTVDPDGSRRRQARLGGGPRQIRLLRLPKLDRESLERTAAVSALTALGRAPHQVERALKRREPCAPARQRGGREGGQRQGPREQEEPRDPEQNGQPIPHRGHRRRSDPIRDGWKVSHVREQLEALQVVGSDPRGGSHRGPVHRCDLWIAKRAGLVLEPACAEPAETRSWARGTSG